MHWILSMTSFTSTDVIGSVIRTGEARLEMFLPDTAAPTTGVATVTFVKVSFRESGAMGKRDDVRYKVYSRPTLSSVTFANTSAGSCTEILEASSSSELSLPLCPSLRFPSLLSLPDKTGVSKAEKKLHYNSKIYSSQLRLYLNQIQAAHFQGTEFVEGHSDQMLLLYLAIYLDQSAKILINNTLVPQYSR